MPSKGSQSPKDKHPFRIHTKYLKQSSSGKQKIEGWVPALGAGDGERGALLVGIAVLLQENSPRTALGNHVHLPCINQRHRKNG